MDHGKGAEFLAGNRHGWFATPHVSWRWCVLACILWGGGLVATHGTEIGTYLESRLARPVDFHARSFLGKDPVISPKLKIYAIDDSTFAKLGSWILSLEEWSMVLKTLAANEPRAIVIDGMFSKADDLNGNLAETVAQLEALPVPVVVGSFVTPAPIQYREALDLTKDEYSLAVLNGEPKGTPIADERLPPLRQYREWYAYGPAKELQHAFRHIGHFLYPGYGSVAPLLRTGDDVVLGHISTFLAKDRKIANGQLFLDGHNVPVDADGYATVNFPPTEAFYEVNRSMRGLIDRARNGKASKLVEKDDVVLIIPQMFTGNVDFKQTPFGYMPGGFVIAAMVNSVLTGEWLKPVAHGEVLIIAAVLGGALIGMKLGALGFWASLMGGFFGGMILNIIMFSYLGVVTPWFLPVIGWLGAGISVFAEKSRQSEKKASRLRQALEGSIADTDLKELLKKPEQVSLEARERVVSLMFIDVVGFSLLAENMLPRMAFDNLKKMLSSIGDTIHQHGGIIDKTLGDGLLCYFGYRFDQDSSTPDHAEQALRCAIKIQEDNLKKNIEAAEAGEPVYPLRIGINTSSCYLGDLGSSNRIDFTVVGNGVNFAKRLEGASDMHAVLIGATTFDLVKGIDLVSKAFTKRFIRIKHHSELVEAFEYDPFHAQPDLKKAALEGFRKCANIERVDQRWPVHDPTKIQLKSDFGAGQLVNFSHGGLSIKLKQLLAKGTRLNVTLDAAQGTLKSLLAKEGIDVLQGEVRWGYEDGGEFVHGFLVTNITEDQSDHLVQYLCEFAFTRDTQKKGA